ncbi:MAG: HAMP domain-containing histidine kinase [Chitinophagaceae bacterium]|nr:HAMP domain-containing histidine kinase [Chitinophagaceae bacterium]
MKIRRRPLLIFYLLVTYIFISFTWWIFLLVRINAEAYNEKKELTQLNYIYQHKVPYNDENSATFTKIDREYHRKVYMIIGEGTVFLVILMVVTLKTNQSLQREYKLNRQQKNFLLSITHELRSPIASSRVALQTMLKRDSLPRNKVELLLNNSLHDMDRLQLLVENILLAAKIEDHAFQIGKDACNLSEIVQTVIDKTVAASEFQRVFNTDIKPEVFVIGDRMALTSVVTNLVENAIKYSADATMIEVAVSEEDKHAFFTISDHGFGIPDAEKKKVFEKFYRIGQEETRKTKGTGLGLYIVGRILELHKGKVTVKDNQPRGSVFQVELPKFV